MLSRLTFLQKPQRPSSPSTRMLDVEGRKLPLTIRADKRARRMTLRIDPGGQSLKLTVPQGLREREINAFLERHQGWLMTKLARFPTSNVLSEGRYVSLRGVPHRIERTGKLRGLPADSLYLAWMDCRGLGMDAEALDKFMLTKARLWCDKGQKFGAEGHGYMRVNLGCPRSTVEEAIGRLLTALR